MESLYKVGDVVTIKSQRESGFNSDDYPFVFTEDMVDRYGGKKAIITKIRPDGSLNLNKAYNGDDYCYGLDIDRGRHDWHSSMFEFGKPKKSSAVKTKSKFKYFQFQGPIQAGATGTVKTPKGNIYRFKVVESGTGNFLSVLDTGYNHVLFTEFGWDCGAELWEAAGFNYIFVGDFPICKTLDDLEKLILTIEKKAPSSLKEIAKKHLDVKEFDTVSTSFKINYRKSKIKLNFKL